MATSSIEWTQKTWNPTTGCTKVSQGCKFCYAEVMARRLEAMGVEKYKDGFKVRVHPSTLDQPRKWAPSVIFVNSMSDLFHEEIPIDFIRRVFDVMNECPQHQFQVLTKRAERLAEVSHLLQWSSNIWMGVSVENQATLFRIKHLLESHAQVKFLSIEPLLEALPDLVVDSIDWVIVGGESGRKIRPIRQEWVTAIRDKCLEKSVPFFFKQWGGTNKKASGRELEGRTWDEMPSMKHAASA
jgi:protein gp37